MKKFQFYFLLITVILISACSGLNDKQKKSAEDALTALKKMDAATDVGINKLEYSRMLIDAQTSVNQASETLPDSELKQEIKLAMESYMDAKNLWFILKNDEIIFLFCAFDPTKKKAAEPADEVSLAFQNFGCNKEAAELRDKYNLRIRDINTKEIKTDNSGVLFKKEGISIIWEKAKEHLTRASVLYNGK